MGEESKCRARAWQHIELQFGTRVCFHRISSNNNRQRGGAKVEEEVRVPDAVTDEAGRAGIPQSAPKASTDPVQRARVWNWIDEVLAESFPASDPPSWTPAVARPHPTTGGGT